MASPTNAPYAQRHIAHVQIQPHGHRHPKPGADRRRRPTRPSAPSRTILPSAPNAIHRNIPSKLLRHASENLQVAAHWNARNNAPPSAPNPVAPTKHPAGLGLIPEANPLR